eukprot:g43934.t1
MAHSCHTYSALQAEGLFIHRMDHMVSSDIRSVFLRVSARKVMALNGVLGQALRSCVDQLADVFTDTFSLSLLQTEVSACFKKTPSSPYQRKHIFGFNIIIPSRLISELHDLGLSYTLYNWILNFLTHSPQSVRT